MPYLGNVPSSFNVGTDNINNDAITTAKIADGAILNADVNAAAAIAGTKISPDFGSQNILTTGTATAASLIPTSSTVPTNGLYLPAANSVAISTNGAARLTITSDGDIRTTWGNDRFLGSYFSSSYYQGILFDGGNSKNLKIVNRSGDTSADIVFLNAINGAPTEKLRITSAGLVGIGTSAPGELLTVSNGNIRIEGSGAQEFVTFFNSSTGGRQWTLANAGAGNIHGVSAGTLYFRDSTAGANRVAIDSSGRVGIGTTSPSAKLAVVYATNGIELDPQFGFVSGTIRAYDRTTSSYKALGLTGDSVVFGISDIEKARIDSSGRLLVGVTSIAASYGTPQVLVVGGDKPLILSNGNNTGTYLEFNTGGANANVEIKADARTGNYPPLLFTTGGTERARITADAYLRLASGTGGIQFNGDTSSVNALDDYEEGTFTVEMQYNSGGSWFGVGFSNTPQTTGYYVKVGKLVTCYYYSTDFQVSSGVGASARFGGLPFAAASLTEGYITGTVTHVTCFQQANQNLYVAPNATNAIPIQQTSTSTNTWNSTSNVYIMWAITYQTV